METAKIDAFLLANQGFFPQESMAQVKEKLASLDEAQLAAANFKSPKTALILAILVPVANQFYVGKIGLGVAKLLTCGGAGIWTIIDWFVCQKNTRKINLEKLMSL